jgi:bifunctional non-homologous end joining protein LigD
VKGVTQGANFGRRCRSQRGAYIPLMLWRSSRGRPRNAPAGFIHPCQPTVAKRPPSGPGWAHELKHDGYRLQIHVRDGRVRLYTMNGADWSKRYPRIIESAAIKGSVVLDAEAVWLDPDGVPNFDALHSRENDKNATALAFDLLSLNGHDLRKRPFIERKAELHKVLKHGRRGIQYVEHVDGDGIDMFAAVCKLGLEGIISKRINAPYRSGPTKTWLKIKNPKSPAATRAADGTF